MKTSRSQQRILEVIAVAATKMRFVAPLAAALGVAVASGSAFAGTTVVNSLSAFLAATTGVSTGDFTSVPLTNTGSIPGTSWGGFSTLSGYSSLQGVTFTTTNPGNVNVNSAGFYGAADLSVPYLVNSVYSGTGIDNLTITLQSALTAFGLDFTTLFSSTTATFGLSNGFTTNVANTPTSAQGAQFIGFLSTTPFTTITFDVPYLQSWVVQDFTAGTNVAVPGPIAGAGLPSLIGLMGFAAWRRRRRAA
jgi:hypothetical protein